MSTLVAFHAHPDDESLIMGGSLARASAEGHRVVVVVATDGDHGEKPADLAQGETLMDRRRAETQRSCDALGVHRLEWLGYSDSGMTGWEQNTHPDAFINADIEGAARALADILLEERADVFVTYEWHGNYGHPDHLQVHRSQVQLQLVEHLE
jgi:LmbE family N-acetylglucosaminyl deacetylase